MNSQEVMRKPFNVETHRQTFINYLEVIINEDGLILYAIPSHQEKVISLACEKLNITRDELNDLCPREYYCDFMNWLCQVSGCVAIWNEFMIGIANNKQVESLEMLRKEKLYHGEIHSQGGIVL